MPPRSCSRGGSTWVQRWTYGYVLRDCRYCCVNSVSLESGSCPVRDGLRRASIPGQEHTGAQEPGAVREIQDSLFHVRRSVHSLIQFHLTWLSLIRPGKAKYWLRRTKFTSPSLCRITDACKLI